MNILMLGPARPDLIRFLESHGDAVIVEEQGLVESSHRLQAADFLITYGYRHILKPNVLAFFPEGAINLDIPMLPWNRGADPNLRSFLEDTPKGVTIHCLEDGLDTGHVIAQAPVEMLTQDTLRTSYDRLQRKMEALFPGLWPATRSGQIEPAPQPAGGSYHALKDRQNVAHLLTNGRDTPVPKLIGRRKGAAAAPTADVETHHVSR